MAIYTKKGDSGNTDLINKRNVKKDDDIVEAYGTIDELNSFLGVLKCKVEEEEIAKKLEGIQKDLFTLGVEVAGGETDYKRIGHLEIEKIEQWIDLYEKDMPPLTHFIIPGGEKEAALMHVARTICRRAERRVVKVSEKEKIRNDAVIYLNRLSDLLFILARWINYKKKTPERQWKGKKLL